MRTQPLLSSLRPAALSALLALCGPARAQTSADAAAPQPAVAGAQVGVAGGLLLSADLRDEYLHGHKLLVALSVRNPTGSTVSFPNLEERPHLVRFDLVAPNGRESTRRTAVPEEDADTLWSIGPRGQRRVVLELPSGGALAQGSYQLGLRVGLGEELAQLGPLPMRVAAARPSSGHLADDGGGFRHQGWASIWLHQAQQGQDLYLHTMGSGQPRQRGLNWHLARLSAAVDPVLSASRPMEGGSRFIYWRDGSSLQYARLQERNLRAAPRTVELPYPSWDLLARGVTTPEGELHAPVWIDAPDGKGGEVRVVSIGQRGRPVFRSVVRLEQRPLAAGAADGAGQLRLLLLHDDKLDHYTLEPSSDLPAQGRRLLPRGRAAGAVDAVEGDQGAVAAGFAGFAKRLELLTNDLQQALRLPPIAGVRFGTLPERGGEPGGKAIFVWLQDEQGGKISGLWLSLEGRMIATVRGATLPPGHRLQQVLPAGYEAAYVLSLDRAGRGWVQRVGWSQPLSIGPVGPQDCLRLDLEGRLALLSLREGRGVEGRLLR